MKSSIKFRLFSLIAIVLCVFLFSLSAMAYTPYGEPNSYDYNPDVGPAYLYKYNDGSWELYAMPILPPTFTDAHEMVAGYDIQQVRNGIITMRIEYSDGSYSSGYDSFAIDANMAGGVLTPKALNLAYKNGTPYLLANNYLVARSETGRYHIYSPDGSDEVIKLDFDYGEKLLLPKYKDYVSAFDDDFYTYVGVGLEYLPKTEQYVLLYCFSPLYGTDGSKEEYWKKNNNFSTPLHVAIFDKQGCFQSSFKLPDVSVFGPIYGDVLNYNNSGENSDFTQSTIENPIFLSNQTNKILVKVESIKGSESNYALIDLEQKTTSAATEQDIQLFFTSYCIQGEHSRAYYDLNASSSLPYSIEYRSDGTYLISDKTKVLRYFPGPYVLAELTQDSDGAYYAFFACDFNTTEHPANRN